MMEDIQLFRNVQFIDGCPKCGGKMQPTHWRRRVLDMKILAYIYLFDILLKITSPRLNGLTNLIFNLHAKDIHDFFNRR